MFLCSPIIGQTLTFKKMPFLMWEPLEIYIFDKSLPHKFVLNMEHRCKEMIHHSHENLINYCNNKRDDMMKELETFCTRVSETKTLTPKRFIPYLVGGIAVGGVLLANYYLTNYAIHKNKEHIEKALNEIDLLHKHLENTDNVEGEMKKAL